MKNIIASIQACTRYVVEKKLAFNMTIIHLHIKMIILKYKKKSRK